MKKIEKIYIGCAVLSFIGFVLAMNRVPPFVSDAHNISMFLFNFAIISLILGIWGSFLIVSAYKRKAAFWSLIVATPLAGLYGVIILKWWLRVTTLFD